MGLSVYWGYTACFLYKFNFIKSYKISTWYNFKRWKKFCDKYGNTKAASVQQDQDAVSKKEILFSTLSSLCCTLMLHQPVHGISASFCISVLFVLSPSLWTSKKSLENNPRKGESKGELRLRWLKLGQELCFSEHRLKYLRGIIGQFSFQCQRKAMQKNAQTTTQLYSSHMLAK